MIRIWENPFLASCSAIRVLRHFIVSGLNYNCFVRMLGCNGEAGRVYGSWPTAERAQQNRSGFA
jgi:hypothetical protein